MQRSLYILQLSKSRLHQRTQGLSLDLTAQDGNNLSDSHSNIHANYERLKKSIMTRGQWDG